MGSNDLINKYKALKSNSNSFSFAQRMREKYNFNGSDNHTKDSLERIRIKLDKTAEKIKDYYF